MTAHRTDAPAYTVPGVSFKEAMAVIPVLQERLHALNDLTLTLKHAHWNVVGPQFIAVHEMLDPQVASIRTMADTTAERIATLGGTPVGTPGALVKERTWDDYELGRAGTQDHLAELDKVYARVVAAHRKAISTASKVDPVSEDMLIGQTAELEQFHWFVRAHLGHPDSTA